MHEAQAAIAEHGALIRDRYGGWRTHPACELEPAQARRRRRS
jgi:hypothetical protein